MPITVGQAAPDFTLFSSNKEKITLSDQEGRNVVLLFFPLAFTSVCTKELCSVKDQMQSFNRLQATVFAISVDSPQTLAKFREEQQLNFTLLSDFNKEVSRAYDALYDLFVMNMRGVSKRAAFVIDRTGILRHAEVLDDAGQLPDFQKIEATLAVLP